jgi:hypothetical protein
MARLARLTWLLAFSVLALAWTNSARAWSPTPGSGTQYESADASLAGSAPTAATDYYGTHEAACAAYFTRYDASAIKSCGATCTYTYTQTACNTTGTGSSMYTRISTRRTRSTDGAISNYTNTLQRRQCTDQAACFLEENPPSTFDCSTLSNVKTLGSANDQPDTFTPKDAICVKNGNVGGANTPMNCAAFKRANQTYKRLGPVNQRDWLVNYQFTGLACDAEPQQTETEPVDTDDKAEKCKTGAGGLTFCSAPDDDTDCGYFNDKYVCLKSLGTDKCMTKADGSRICASGAPTPPKPDNGTPGVPATPDDTMSTQDGQSGTSNTYNYYNTTTNTNSSRDTGTGGSTDGSGAVGPGGEAATTTDGDPTSDDSAGGGIGCDAPPTCDGDPIQCVLLNQQWRTRCPEVPTTMEVTTAMGATEGELDGSAIFSAPEDMSAAWSEAGPISVGACPAPLSVSIMGQSMSLDIWHAGCEMALLFAPIVMAMAYFAAVLLFLRSNW